MNKHPLKQLINARREGKSIGIYSICSANDYVIMAGMERARRRGDPVLVEATANQVNQYGGYTGMTPKAFRAFVEGLAEKMSFPLEQLIFGGDHLGPLTWKKENEAEAMAKAEELVRGYVEAGFTKIHIDTSMRLADDDGRLRLNPAVVAQRGARLARVAEDAFEKLVERSPLAVHPVYVVGSEVPVPGGAAEEEGIRVTSPEDFEETVALFREAFSSAGVGEAFEHVIAVVVQPGVEFGNDTIHDYDREAARELCGALKGHPELVLEGHSTDYQTRLALKQMVEDGIAVLKVGPALTYSLREGLFLLALIEKELFAASPEKQSYFTEILDAVMLEYPDYWKPYYHGNPDEIRRARKYGLSDRSRYYLAHPRVRGAQERLMENLRGADLPLSLISQYLPAQYERIREGVLDKKGDAILMDRVGCLIDDYLYATEG